MVIDTITGLKVCGEYADLTSSTTKPTISPSTTAPVYVQTTTPSTTSDASKWL